MGIMSGQLLYCLKRVMVRLYFKSVDMSIQREVWIGEECKKFKKYLTTQSQYHILNEFFENLW